MSGRYDIKPSTTLRAPKFNVAKFDSLRMKPLGAAARARHRPTLIVGNAQFMLTTWANYYCQNTTPRSASPESLSN